MTCRCPAYVADAAGVCTEARECGVEVVAPILTKPQSYGLWVSGAYGTRLRSWRTFAAYEASGFSGLVSLRYLGDGNGPCHYDLEPWQVSVAVATWLARGLSADRIMINESAPDEAVVLQGEYLNDVYLDEAGGVRVGYLHYSRARAKMRTALARAPQVAAGLHASLLLRGAMTPSSWADWEVLCERYPGHVLEVSVYSRCLGDVPGRNALVWEVRRY